MDNTIIHSKRQKQKSYVVADNNVDFLMLSNIWTNFVFNCVLTENVKNQ